MKKIPAIAALVLFLFALPAFTAVCSTVPAAADQPVERGLPLEFTNNYGSDIKYIFISDTGRNSWSEDLLKGSPLKKGGTINLDIDRKNILGLADLKIVYPSGKERIWQKLPILEIFEIAHNKDGKPDYERLKLGA